MNGHSFDPQYNEYFYLFQFFQIVNTQHINNGTGLNQFDDNKNNTDKEVSPPDTESSLSPDYVRHRQLGVVSSGSIILTITSGSIFSKIIILK